LVGLDAEVSETYPGSTSVEVAGAQAQVVARGIVDARYLVIAVPPVDLDATRRPGHIDPSVTRVILVLPHTDATTRAIAIG